MALEMRVACEKCSRTLRIDDEAYICSYESHVLRGMLCANEATLPELRRRIAAAAKTQGFDRTHIVLHYHEISPRNNDPRGAE
jgi:hypothetical protein